MQKIVQVHMLPTDKKPYSLEQWGNWFFDTSDSKYSNREPKPIGQHLYFTSEEEIKEGEWGIMQAFGEPKVKKAWDNSNSGLYKKIVATTNPELWDLKQRNLVWYDIMCAKIPLSFVKQYVEKQVKEVKLETTYLANEYTGEGHIFPLVLKLDSQGCVIISPIEEKLYTLQDIENAFKTPYLSGKVHPGNNMNKDWKEYKNKHYENKNYTSQGMS